MFLISSLIFYKPVSAQEEIENYVNASFNIEMETATDFKININMNVIKAVAFGTTYDENEVKSLTTSIINDDIEALGVIKNYLHTSLASQLSDTFGSNSINSLNKKPIFENSQFNEEYAVNLTSDFFKMNETVNAHNFLNGMLDMGAKLDYDFKLYAKEGWNNTYSFDLGENILYKRTDAQTESYSNIIQWIVKNGGGLNPYADGDLIIFLKNPTTALIDEQDIFLNFEIDSSAKKTSLNSNILCKKINIEKYGVIPDFILNLTHVNSDGFRLLVDNGFITWEDFNTTTIKPIEDKIKTNIETDLFNQSLKLVSSWDDETTNACPDAYDVNNMDSKPAIKSIFTDDVIDFKIYDISDRSIFGLVNTGATANVSEEDINFGESLSNIGYPYNISLLMPQGVFLQGQNKYTWNNTISFSGDFNSDISPNYKDDVIDTYIEIDIASSDLNLASFFTGSTELTFNMDINENKKYNVTSLPEEFSLPNKIAIDYLNADALRLCIEENVFSQKDVNNFLDNNKKSLQDRLNKEILPGLGIRCRTNKKTFEKSLIWDGDITQMDGEDAVKVHSYGSSSYPISFNMGLLPPSVDIPVKTISFTGLPDQSVTYRMIFPKEISISASDPYGSKDIIVNKTKDGRYYFELEFSPSEYNLTTDVSVKMTPSTVFVIGIFMPCIITFVILLIIIIVIFIFRKKRRGRKIKEKTPVSMEEDYSGYEGEDYYVPPPPGSK